MPCITYRGLRESETVLVQYMHGILLAICAVNPANRQRFEIQGEQPTILAHRPMALWKENSRFGIAQGCFMGGGKFERWQETLEVLESFAGFWARPVDGLPK
jgi:hypothetical protein